MNLGSASLFARLCCGLSVAVLTLALSLDGSRPVRAEDADNLTTSLQEMIVDPIMKTVQGLEARLTGLEAAIGGMTESFGSRRVVAQVLCVSEETGGQTCITKAQLDAILTGIARAEINPPAVAVTEAKAAPTEETVESIVPKDTSRYPAADGVVEEQSVSEQQPTGSIRSASSGAAIVLHPEIEVTEEPEPVQATPAEPPAQSDE